MQRALSGMSAAVVIGRLTLRRALRGKLAWLTLGLALLPLVGTALAGSYLSGTAIWHQLYTTLVAALVVVLAALHTAPIVGEEVEDRTFTYLWSRPFPRWALLGGKLLALAPCLAAVLGAGVMGAFFMAFGADWQAHADALGRGLGGVVCGVVAASVIAVGIGSLVPRHATAAAIVYLLSLDALVGAMPFAIHNLSVTRHMRVVANLAGDGSTSASLLWLLGLSAVWLGIAVWRITVAEYATDK